MKVIDKALGVAKRDLKSCECPIGLVAGRHHFVDLWARDSLFATFGANRTGLQDISRKTIETFLKYQREDGLIPYRVLRAKTNINKYRGKPDYFAKAKANYRSHQSGGIVPDGGLMTIIAARDYFETSKDTAFIKKYYEKLKTGIEWYIKRFKGGLVSEWFLCEWADAVMKVGKTLYTNVLFYKAISDFSYLASQINKTEDVRRFLTLANGVAGLVRAKFWNGRYFADWVDYKRQDYFSSPGNMLAVLFGLSKGTEARMILEYGREKCWNGFTLETNYPKYPWWRIPVQNHLFGLADYHNRGCLWLQPGLLYAAVLAITRQKTLAKQVFERIAEKILEYGRVFEVYEKSGRPVERRWYKSEGPFAWSASLFIYTTCLLDLNPKTTDEVLS